MLRPIPKLEAPAQAPSAPAGAFFFAAQLGDFSRLLKPQVHESAVGRHRKKCNGLRREPTVRHTPETMDEVRKCLDHCPSYMKVEVKPGVPVVAKTVGDLRSLATWPSGLVLNFPRPGDRYPGSVVEVELAS
jgi:hypothetical protein